MNFIESRYEKVLTRNNKNQWNSLLWAVQNNQKLVFLIKNVGTEVYYDFSVLGKFVEC